MISLLPFPVFREAEIKLFFWALLTPFLFLFLFIFFNACLFILILQKEV